MDENPKFVSAKKGLYRLWLTLSVIWWVIGLIVLFVIYFDGGFRGSQYVYDGPVDMSYHPSAYQNLHDEVAFHWKKFLLFLLPVVLPPFALYFFSKACYWIYKGFKEDDGSHPPRL